jgi:hypothetical protein
MDDLPAPSFRCRRASVFPQVGTTSDRRRDTLFARRFPLRYPSCPGGEALVASIGSDLVAPPHQSGSLSSSDKLLVRYMLTR